MASTLKYLAVYSLIPSPDNLTQKKIQIVIDLRKLTHRPAVTLMMDDTTTSTIGEGEEAKKRTNDKNLPYSALMHVGSKWERAHNAHVFVDGRLVFHFAAAITLSESDMADGSSYGCGCALETIALQSSHGDGIEFEAFSDDEAIDEKPTTTTMSNYHPTPPTAYASPPPAYTFPPLAKASPPSAETSPQPVETDETDEAAEMVVNAATAATTTSTPIKMIMMDEDDNDTNIVIMEEEGGVNPHTTEKNKKGGSTINNNKRKRAAVALSD